MTKSPRPKSSLPDSAASTKRARGKSSVSGGAPVNQHSNVDQSNARQAKVLKADSYHTIYANYSKVGISQWDMTITFGQTVDSENGESDIEELVSVKFSPQYFKAVTKSLATALAQWEKIFGELKDGLGQAPNLEGMEEIFMRFKDQIEAREKARKR